MIIPETIYEEMVRQCHLNLPYEACGLLSGNEQTVQSLWVLQNELKSDRRFFVSKMVVEETLLKVKNKGERVLVIYHSHPTTAPVPSYTDRMNHPDDGIMMMIVSFKTLPPIVKGYQLQSNSYLERPIFIDPL